MSTCWDPGQYLRYGDERSRPFGDLLARVPTPDPAAIVDLGCGPGATTATLLERWPDARVVGIDSSPDMIARAGQVAVPGRLDFRLGDLRSWRPATPVDVILSTATFQWVPGHIELFPNLIRALTPGGSFAFQVPGNFRQPSHRLLREVAGSPRWADRLGSIGRDAPVHDPAEYLDVMVGAGAVADVWETTYLHVLSGPDAVLEWVKGTALRPYLTALAGAPGAAEAFLAEYGDRLRSAYPVRRDGTTVFPFRRIFGVAVASGEAADPVR